VEDFGEVIPASVQLPESLTEVWDKKFAELQEERDADAVRLSMMIGKVEYLNGDLWNQIEELKAKLAMILDVCAQHPGVNNAAWQLIKDICGMTVEVVHRAPDVKTCKQCGAEMERTKGVVNGYRHYVCAEHGAISVWEGTRDHEYDGLDPLAVQDTDGGSLEPKNVLTDV